MRKLPNYSTSLSRINSSVGSYVGSNDDIPYIDYTEINAEELKSYGNTRLAYLIPPNFNNFINKGSIEVPSGSFGIYGGQKVLLRKSYIETIYDPNNTTYRSVNGKPLNQYKRVGDMTGFTICDSFHLENFKTATSAEINAIDSLLREGIIL